ncbi:MAG: site-specific DNA-methyltransferase, partial [Methanosarcinaceae archaeon]
IVCYTRSKELFETSRGLLPMTEEGRKRYKNPGNDPRGDWQSVAITAQAGHGTSSQFYDIITPSGRKVTLPPGNCWRVTEKRLSELIRDNRIWFGKDGNNVPRIKKFLSESKGGLTPHTLWKADEVGTTNSTSKALLNILGGESLFETPKPIELVKRMTAISAQHDCSDIVLDFFAGSATTAHAVLDLNKEDGGNRKFIMVQLPEKCAESSEAFKSGYKTIAEIGKERIRRVIKKIEADSQTKLDINDTADKQDLGFKVFKLRKSNFKIWRSDVKTKEELAAQLTLHIDPVDEDATVENILYELILKSGVLLTARIEEKGGYYLVNGGEIALMLERVNESFIKKVIAENPNKVITLDRFFSNDDQLKTNSALQMKDAGIEFKAV